MGNKSSQTSSGEQQSSISDQQVAAQELTPEFNTARLLHLAFLLTTDDTFNIGSQGSIDALLGGNPSIGCDRKTGPFIDMISAITNGTYEGQDPIGDIKMTLQQLASCQKTPENQSLLERIGDFFLNKDSGKAIRRFLLLTQILIKCLSLWYVMKVNGLLTLNDDMKTFTRNAFSSGQIPDGSSLFPPEIMTRIRQWNAGDMDSVVETFSIGENNKAPVLLIFNDVALNQVLEQPTEAILSQTAMSSKEPMPVTFVPEKDLRKFIANYLQSGNLNASSTSYN